MTLAVTAGNDPSSFLGVDVATGQAVLDSDGIAVTSNSEALTWRDNGNGTFDAVLSNGDAVFKIKLPDDFSLEANGSTT
ncbi:hypothetical protein O9992_20320 [Vibrio lentus]|nr:hypothetical protein [Vibrio lentus]